MARPKGLANGDLTPKEQAFAEHLVTNGGNGTKAAIAAGYSAKGAHVTASRLKRNPKVLKYLREMSQEMIDGAAPEAISTIRKLLKNKSGYVRLEAARDILDRAGVGNQKTGPAPAGLVVNINLDAAAPTPAIEDVTSRLLDAVSTPADDGGVENEASR